MTLIGFFTMLPSILWPLAFTATAAIGCYAFSLYLKRESIETLQLKSEIVVRDREWEHKFAATDDKYDRRVSAIERALNAQQQGKNPLGAHYDTRRSG